MIWIDYVFLALMAVAVVYGVWTGFMMQLTFLAGIGAAALFAGRLSRPVAEWLAGVSTWMNENPGVCSGVCYVVMFLIVLVGVVVVGILLHKVLKKLRFGVADRVLGGVVGLLASALICVFISVAIVLWSSQDGSGPEEDSIAAKSKLIPVFAKGAKLSRVFVSEEKQERIRHLLDKISDE